ncbi:MAG: hypothetical protein QCI38_04995 [Candidatus Thermoplasmatota archaeon]|nr:hypothetical protein [Candidatus Thermoplasmatota archaeon]
MTEDWLSCLDKDFEELAKKEVAETRARLVASIMDVFFGIWLRFDIDRGVRMQLTPFEWEYVEYKGHKDWRLVEDFNFNGIGDVELMDIRFPHRQGLRAEIYKTDGANRVRLIFLLEDWRDGDRTGFTPYLLYDAQLYSARISDLWKEMKKIVIPWHEAHIRGDPEPLWDWIKSNYMELPRV